MALRERLAGGAQVIITRDLDCAALYARTRREFVDLLHPLSKNQLATRVPATPAWSARDVLAHVVGIAADLNAGRFGKDDPDAWTANQVAGRRAMSVGDLGDEWEREAKAFEEGLRLFGYELGSHYLGDLVQHVSDVRSALGFRRVTDDEALLAATDFYLDSFHQALVDAAIGAVTVRSSNEVWTLGAGAEIAAVTAPRFEVFRALGGRRSTRQIRALDWTGDAERVLPVVSRYPLPEVDLVDS